MPTASDSSGGVLDLTNGHLRDLSTVELSPNLTFVDLTANRLSTLEPSLLALTGLRALNLRQNILPDLSALATASFAGSVQDLELRDNLLTELPSLPGFSSLTRLEVSYNQIRSLAPLTSLAAAADTTADSSGNGQPTSSSSTAPPPPPLAELYCASNKVSVIEGLSAFSHLTLLELGSNRVREISGLQANTALQELWLGRNRIAAIQGLDSLGALQRLSLQSNRLESMAGLGACTSLVELYLSHNGIWALDPALSRLTGLRVLDVSSNRISRVEHLAGLSCLQDLWLNDNAIPSLDGLQYALADQASSLTTIYLAGNPAAQQAGYRERLLELFPNLLQLDADVLGVVSAIKAAAAQRQQARQQERQQQQQQGGAGAAAQHTDGAMAEGT